MYCLHKLGYQPGRFVGGNSVVSRGVMGDLSSGVQAAFGGELKAVTRQISDGRRHALDEMKISAKNEKASGITNVTSQLIKRGGDVEFLSTGAVIHANTTSNMPFFASFSEAQELYLQITCSYQPIDIVFGNIAYAQGVGRGIGAALEKLKRGEVRNITEVFKETRHKSLERIQKEARAIGANSVVGIRTSIIPLYGATEMVMIGTASHNSKVASELPGELLVSDLTGSELWSLATLGQLPLSVVLGVSVYSLGVMGGVGAFFSSLGKGEVQELSTFYSEARESSLEDMRQEAHKLKADQVVGTRLYINDLGGDLIECLTIGTAVKKVNWIDKPEPMLIQSVISDQNTFYQFSEDREGISLSDESLS